MYPAESQLLSYVLRYLRQHSFELQKRAANEPARFEWL
jgi:hypothetical protein